MADEPISGLTDGGLHQPDDQIPVARSGSTLRVLSVGADGWISDSAETWTYVSATSFKVSGTDVTAKYTPGTRLRLKQGAGYLYFNVVSSTFSTDTTITITGGSDYALANTSITSNYHSYAENPQGWPSWFNFNPSSAGFGSTTQDAGRFQVVGRTVFVQFSTSGTSNATTWTWTLPITSGGSLVASIFICRVTDNGTIQTSPGAANLSANSATITMRKALNVPGGFTASGTKAAVGEFFYEF